MSVADLQDGLDRLYGAPLEDFIAERTRLAKELRGEGDRETAEDVGKLAKPTAAAWALNHVAREEPEAVEDWLDAARALREASAAPAEGDELRDAIAAHREATVRLTNVARDRAEPTGKPLSAAMVERVRALLRSATSDEDALERLRAGRVTEEPASAELALAAPAGSSPKRAAKPARGGAKGGGKATGSSSTKSAKASSAVESAPGRRPLKRERAAEARAARRAELERRIEAARAEAERLRADSDTHAKKSADADDRLEEARRNVRRSESEASAARQAAKDADHAAAVAERDLRRLEGLLSRADG
jgi:hypothetical protein